MRLYAISALAGSVVLAATAAFHATGFPGVMESAAGINDKGLRAIIGPLWIFPSAHWAFLAVIAGLAAFLPGARLILALCGVLLLVDASILYFHLGPFIGEAMLAVAGLLFLAAAALRSRAR